MPSRGSQVCQAVVEESAVRDLTAVVVAESFVRDLTTVPSVGPQAAVKTPLAARLHTRMLPSITATVSADAEKFFKTIDLRLKDDPESFWQADWLIAVGVPVKNRNIIEADIALVAMLDAADTTFDSGAGDLAMPSASTASRGPESGTAAMVGAPSLWLRSSRRMAGV